MNKSFSKIINIIVELSGLSILIAAFIVTYDVIIRKVFNSTISGADEISGYIFAISTAFAYSYALITRSNIRIDFIYNKLSLKIRSILDIVAMIANTFFFAIVCYYSFDIISDAIVHNSKSITPLQIPLAIPQTPWFIGLCLAFITSFILLILSLFSLIKGNFNNINKLIGIPSLQQGIEQEINNDKNINDSDRKN